MILALIIFLKRAKNELLELAAPLARNDLNAFGFLGNGLFHDLVNRLIEFVAFGINIVKIEFKIHIQVHMRTSHKGTGGTQVVLPVFPPGAPVFLCSCDPLFII